MFNLFSFPNCFIYSCYNFIHFYCFFFHICFTFAWQTRQNVFTTTQERIKGVWVNQVISDYFPTWMSKFFSRFRISSEVCFRSCKLSKYCFLSQAENMEYELRHTVWKSQKNLIFIFCAPKSLKFHLLIFSGKIQIIL